MSMETTAWAQLRSVITAEDERRPVTRDTLRRIGAFARPHRRKLILFLLLGTATAALAVATPVLAGRVVNTIVSGGDPDTVVRLALLIALIAVVEAALGVLGRRLSAALGEDLILGLRTAVFDHVQRMPVAFFTRTRTGALVSRLNNDVIGAQRAFSSTLSTVVANVVTLILTLGVMLTLSWQITLLALVLLPVFVIPARRMGRRMAGLQREAATLDAAMGTRMTERFSAPGATLVKLFGRPEEESEEFAVRARRVRDIGVRTATAQTVFITALTLVSALALALVYGLGGRLALSGALDAGAVVALALLLTRLYAPLTSLAGARVEVMSALVSFERVFEVPLSFQRPSVRVSSPSMRLSLSVRVPSAARTVTRRATSTRARPARSSSSVTAPDSTRAVLTVSASFTWPAKAPLPAVSCSRSSPVVDASQRSSPRSRSRWSRVLRFCTACSPAASARSRCTA